MSYLLNAVNPPATTVNDLRTGTFTKRNAACLTPWGQFRSVAVAVEHVMQHEGAFMAPLIVKKALEMADWAYYKHNKIVPEYTYVMEVVKRNLYQTIYRRCKTGSETNNGQFRLL